MQCVTFKCTEIELFLIHKDRIAGTAIFLSEVCDYVEPYSIIPSPSVVKYGFLNALFLVYELFTKLFSRL